MLTLVKAGYTTLGILVSFVPNTAVDLHLMPTHFLLTGSIFRAFL